MTFTVGERFTKQFQHRDVDLSAYPGLTARWVFGFRDGRITAYISSSAVEQLAGTGDIITTFPIPAGFFTAERAGPLVYQVLLYKEDSLVLWSRKVSDRLEQSVAELADVVSE